VAAARTTSASSVGALIEDGSTLNVNGHTITFKNAPTPGGFLVAYRHHRQRRDRRQRQLDGLPAEGTVADVLKAIDLATGVQTAALGVSGATVATASGATNSSVGAGGVLKISTGTVADLSITGTGNSLAVLGLTGATGTDSAFTASRGSNAGGVNGKTLTFTSFNAGAAVNITFGDGTTAPVKSLAQLNTALQANNLTATVDANGKLQISASNDFASSTLGSAASGGSIGGTLTTTQTSRSPRLPLPTRLRRLPAPTWLPNTTTSWTRSPPRPRMPRSTASTSSVATP